MSDPTRQLQNITPSIGPYRFKYPDDGLAVYRMNNLVEQYLFCDEYFWWQVLRVGRKTFKSQVFLHTKEEQQVKVWKKFRGMERVERPLSDSVNVKKQTVGQFRLVWMSKADLLQAVQILKKQKDDEGRYKPLIEILEDAIAQKQEDDVPQTSSCCFSFNIFWCNCGGCDC